MTKIYPLLICLIFLPFVIHAQDDLATDRPGEGTNSATTVDKGYFQIEAGFYYQHDTDQQGEKSTAILIPNVVARLGLFNNFELRIERDYISDGEQLGKSALAIGAKVGILDESVNTPALALQTLLTLPSTGSSDYENEYTQPAMLLLLSKNITGLLSITTNLGVSWENDSPRALYSYGLSLDATLTDDLTAFLESYGTLPEGQVNQHLVDYGLAYLLTPNFQLDISSGAALTPEATDYFVSMGLVWRVNVWGR